MLILELLEGIKHADKKYWLFDEEFYEYSEVEEQ